jgi:hypothetical protein
MNSLFFYRERLHSDAYLAELHSKDPNPYDTYGEGETQSRPRQVSPIERAKLAHLLNQRL